MSRLISVPAAALAILIVFAACKKNDNKKADPTAHTVANFSGAYLLTDLRVTAPIDSNAYNSLDACEKDNLTVLNSDMTVKIEDVGVICEPASDTTGTWSLSAKADSMYINGNGEFIKSWDGTTLVLTGSQEITNTGFTIKVSTEATFQKQKP